MVKSNNPKIRFTKAELTQAAIKHVKNTPMEQYGVWVYYSWLNKLIHLLDEDEFIKVRTNRNQYKITPQESEILKTKKIGIIGLSVGKAIATTIAMERICGELRLADFDVIELSNLNRIQTGVQNFGVKKTIVVAREIAEIDPYLKVTTFSDGLTEENVDDFFMKNGSLNVCIEVCDGLYTKIFARQKAKALKIPVVMNSSDRGTTDVERFDLNNDLPILHGLIDHLDLNLVKQAKTNEEKVPYLLPMLGVETSSNRLKASMIEIEETITTWPQLASGVIFGGGICADVCRRLLLNQFIKSGRYFVDVEDLINNSTPNYIEESKKNKIIIKPNLKTDVTQYNTLISKVFKKLEKQNSFYNLEKKELKLLIQNATLAPSGGNAQPWFWIYKNKTLFLFHDKEKSKSILNYKNSAAYIALGAATENLMLTAQANKLQVTKTAFPLGNQSDLIAIFNFTKNKSALIENYPHSELVNAIPLRCTNRKLSKKIALKKEEVIYLKKLANTLPHCELKLFESEKETAELKEILAEVDRLYLTNKTGHACFTNEMRWTKEEVEFTKDGIDINTLDITPTEKAGMLVNKNWQVSNHLKHWNLGMALGKITKKTIDSSSALGLITFKNPSFETYYNMGEVIEKIWLGATLKKLAFQPISISTFLFLRVNDGNFDGIEDIKEPLLKLYHKYKKTTKLKDNERAMFFFKISKADDVNIKSIRKNLKDVLIHD